MFQATTPPTTPTLGSQQNPIVVESDDEDTVIPVRHWNTLFQDEEEANDSGYDDTIWLTDSDDE